MRAGLQSALTECAHLAFGCICETVNLRQIQYTSGLVELKSSMLVLLFCDSFVRHTHLLGSSKVTGLTHSEGTSHIVQAIGKSVFVFGQNRSTQRMMETWLQVDLVTVAALNRGSVACGKNKA